MSVNFHAHSACTRDGRLPRPRTLADLEIEPATGQITALKIGDHSMPADALIGVGRYATVVVDPQN
jgi:hypothetical protein